MYTYMRDDGWQANMWNTDKFKPLPHCVEVMAQAWHWDPFGHRWGRGSHWPVLATIGTGRYRSVQMRQKRAKKKWDKQAARQASDSWQSGTALAVSQAWGSTAWGSQAWCSTAWGVTVVELSMRERRWPDLRWRARDDTYDQHCTEKKVNTNLGK